MTASNVTQMPHARIGAAPKGAVPDGTIPGGAISDSAAASGDSINARRRWMGVLARADAAALRDAARGLERRPRYAFLREPEVGMVMVRGRAGGAGVRFNLGEMTMTRCSIRLENAPELAAGLEPNGAPQRHGAAVAGPEASGPGAPGPTPAPGPVIGHAYVAGRDKAHAELAALFDALLQVPALGPRLLDTLVRELELEQAERARRRQQRTDATRVNFFTLVRGEDAEEK